ncbi:toll-like receptor Tollo [Episyrphus balteatus]|uniref:toll-like receptor Tollo n=1 Tax=Episyrphus balteatus TaxID=286459 RepID=UPI0024858F9C|nr:toll-like receptor Tollo [Episyrphus balteatus]XP_055837136.1 toll-like receptor Tollo [Episyrphus balteatus]
MLLKWFVLCLWAMPVLTGTKKCPMECSCSTDEKDRYQTLCLRGGLSAFPASQLDPDVRVVIIKGPKNSITIGPIFKSFVKLEILKITDSNVPAIGHETFWGNVHLRILDLSKNNITNVSENNFRGQDNLHELDLSKNKIYSMATLTFRHLTDLRRLNLADNSIEELVHRNFFMLNKLKFLDLSGNPLQDLQPDVFRDVPELKVLKCRNCQLKKINPHLYDFLPHLSELDFGRNEFKFMDKDEFRDVKRLTKVLLDGNQLSVVVDELFRMQKSLEHLDLSYNRLAKVPNDAFQNLMNLTYLDLSYNKLVRLEPQSVRRLTSLQTLNISGNTQMDLHEIRDTFELIPQLTSLAIADMGILPMGLLVPFKQLRYLNISGNHLDNMSLQVIDPCRELEFLDLSRNQLYGINEDTALRIQSIRNVRLDNNPLICDECHMGKLINIVRHLQWKWDTYPICFLPKSLRGAEITDLDITGLDTCLEFITDEEKDAASTSHNFLERGGLNTLAILGGIIFVLIAIIILAMAVCFSRHRARYYTREDRRAGGDGKCLEKNSDTSPAITGNEINFKFPIDDRVCTIDELVLPPAPPPPTKSPPGPLTQNQQTVATSQAQTSIHLPVAAKATAITVPTHTASAITGRQPTTASPISCSSSQHQCQSHSNIVIPPTASATESREITSESTPTNDQMQLNITPTTTTETIVEVDSN